MKKGIAALVVIAVIIGVVFGFRNVNLNRLGAVSHYVQITESGTKIEDTISTGEVIVRYEYTLPAYNKEGNKKELTFRSNHELRKDAYLNLFLKDGKGVTSYQEVKKEEIPAEAMKKLK
ncbi:YxeA family protein [Sporosarcina limicola]|uniref:Uncharacterized protein (TIGR01655 family) n=1 Tax=Sporosarcina limicola TaxID=34101 RepID=A0A927MIB5_9BACL|nr:YxeA family protein [Sporosarcina limicola]MBE1555229.1 uncharacterized protein (TIGR01655 family) [Sporosarcina limicola]